MKKTTLAISGGILFMLAFTLQVSAQSTSNQAPETSLMIIHNRSGYDISMIKIDGDVLLDNDKPGLVGIKNGDDWVLTKKDYVSYKKYQKGFVMVQTMTSSGSISGSKVAGKFINQDKPDWWIYRIDIEHTETEISDDILSANPQHLLLGHCPIVITNQTKFPLTVMINKNQYHFIIEPGARHDFSDEKCAVFGRTMLVSVAYVDRDDCLYGAAHLFNASSEGDWSNASFSAWKVAQSDLRFVKDLRKTPATSLANQ